MHTPPSKTSPTSPAQATTPAGEPLETSRSGAVLGQPRREHGAYGMVKAPSAATQTPSPGERAVRGLGPDAGRAAEDYLLDPRDMRVPSRPTEPPVAAPDA